MKIAILSESAADEAAVRVFVEALLGRKTELVATPFEACGWNAVLGKASRVLTHLHYHTNADGLVVVVDSDESPIHTRGHNQEGGADPKCRFCQLKAFLAETQAGLKSRQGRGPIKVAVGLAVPAIEAWYLVGRNRQVRETAWMPGQQSRKPPYTKVSLKTEVYDTDRPPLELAKQCAAREANRIAKQADLLQKLEQLFPDGFGEFASSIRQW
jgi:hypothetical protein